MGKQLSEMSLEELWRLFPITLTEPCPCWGSWYEEEASGLIICLPLKSMRRISHIGSTAINGIWAKPIIDILIEMSENYDLRKCKDILSGAGYQCMSEKAGRISFNKGYTKEGFAERVYHLHLRKEGDHDELYFRDYLNAYPHKAKEYEALKLKLWKQYEYNRDAYTESKAAFVQEQTRLARLTYMNRYEDSAGEG